MDNYLAQNAQKKHKVFHCKKCHYSTSHSGMWNRHLKTKKHNATQMLPNADYLGNSGQKKAENAWICGCGKSYKHKQSFYRHKAKCTYIEKDIKEDNSLAIQENVDLKNILGMMNNLVEDNRKLSEKIIN